jgi:hypothetical protein
MSLRRKQEGELIARANGLVKKFNDKASQLNLNWGEDHTTYT